VQYVDADEDELEVDEQEEVPQQSSNLARRVGYLFSQSFSLYSIFCTRQLPKSQLRHSFPAPGAV